MFRSSEVGGVETKGTRGTELKGGRKGDEDLSVGGSTRVGGGVPRKGWGT